MFTEGCDRNDEMQGVVETMLKMNIEGLNADQIARCFGWESAAVKDVIKRNLENSEYLARELEKLQRKAAKYRCAYSKHLTHCPVQAKDRNIYEKRVLEEWLKSNSTSPATGEPMSTAPSEVLQERKGKVRAFSEHALEVLGPCIRINVQREASVLCAAECLSVLSAASDIQPFLEIFEVTTQEEQVQVLGSLKELRPSLLKKLLMQLAPLKNFSRVTLLLLDAIQETHLTAKHANAKVCIRNCMLTWLKASQGSLTALMSLCLAKLHLKINKRARAEEYLAAISFSQPPDDALSEFHASLGDIHYDLGQTAQAEDNYRKCISFSKNPDSLTRVHARLLLIEETNEKQSIAIPSWLPDYELIKQYSETNAQLLSYQDRASVEKTIYRCLNSCEGLLPSNVLASLYHHLGTLHSLKGEFNLADDFLNKSMRILEEIVPAPQKDLGEIYSQLGSVKRSLGNLELSELFLKKSLTIYEEILPYRDPVLASLYNRLGLLYDCLHDFVKAEEFYNKCLRINEEIMSPNDSALAIIYNNIGLMHENRGDLVQAEQFYLKSVAIFGDDSTPTHSLKATCLFNLGELYLTMRNFAKAEKYLMMSLKISEQTLPANHPNLKAIYVNLGNLHRSLGKEKLARKYYQKFSQFR
jgi:tetratricopeptide (TPR) repeat protein